MEICCADKLIEKAKFECCNGEARERISGKRCCNKRDGYEDYKSTVGEKCCIGEDGLGQYGISEGYTVTC